MGPKQPVSVAGIEFDALIESSERYNANVPQYPIETGVSVTDNIALDQTELAMTLYVTNTPVTWKSRHGTNQNRVDEICDQLLSAYFERTPVEVVRSDKVWRNMAIKSISIEKSADTGYAREIPIVLGEITITNTAVVQIPDSYSKGGKTKENNGSAKTASASGGSGSDSSGKINTSGAFGTGESHYAYRDDAGNIFNAAGEKIGTVKPTAAQLGASAWTLDSYMGQHALGYDFVKQQPEKIRAYAESTGKNSDIKSIISQKPTAQKTTTSSASDRAAAFRQKLTGDYTAKSWGEVAVHLLTGQWGY